MHIDEAIERVVNLSIYQSGTQSSIDATDHIDTSRTPEHVKTTMHNQEDQSLTQQVDEILHMIEDNTNKDTI